MSNLTEEKQKTIFIVIARGFIVRNILRSGVLEGLKNKGHKVVIFFAHGTGEKEKQGLIDEFTTPDVSIEFLPPDTDLDFQGVRRFFYRIFKNTAPYLVYSRSTWKYSRIGNVKKMNRSIFWAYLEKYVYGFLSHLHFLKRVARFVETRFFYKPFYAHYFKKYKPDLVFSTSIVSKQDIQFIKEAKRFGVVSVSMPKGWDNVSKMLYRVVPDILVVQNQIMRRDAIGVQRLATSSVVVCGFPQFDWYRRPEILMSREALFNELGFDPSKKLIFFGSEGVWAPKDDSIAETLGSFVNKTNILKKSCVVLVRPHFSDVRSTRFDRFKNIPNLRVDTNYTLSNYFNDNWNPSILETKLFVNCLYHCDVMVAVASTLVLDAAAFNKPLIGVAYGVLFNQKTGKDISHDLYESDHFQSVMATDAVALVRTDQEFKDALNKALIDPDYKSKERKNLIDTLCFKIDGLASSRIVTVIHNALAR